MRIRSLMSGVQSTCLWTVAGGAILRQNGSCGIKQQENMQRLRANPNEIQRWTRESHLVPVSVL